MAADPKQRPEYAERARVIGVVAHQRGHVERRRQPRLPVVEQVVEALVGLLDRAEAGELAHRPELAPVHRGVGAAGEGVLAGAPDPLLEARLEVLRAVERIDLLARDRRELHLALGVLRPLLGIRRHTPKSSLRAAHQVRHASHGQLDALRSGD